MSSNGSPSSKEETTHAPRLRITVLCPSYVWTPGGGFRVIYEYANHLVKRGHQVSIVHPRRLKYAPKKPPENLRGWVREKVFAARNLVSKPSIPWQPIDSRVNMLYVPSSDARYFPDADVLFASAWQTVQSVLECPPSKGEKFILIQGREVDGDLQLVEEKTWRSPLHRVVISKWIREMGESLGAGDMVYIPNAIDHERYRMKTPVKDRPLQVAMLYSDVKIKGAADGIAALQIVKQKIPGLKAIIFGIGPRRSWIPEWIEYHRNPDQQFIVDKIYNGSRVILSPSWMEGFALPPAEAAACGCAIVSTDSGGIREYVEDGRTGLLSAPKNPDALAENLCRVLGDDNLRIRLVEQAQQEIGLWNWDRSAELMETHILNTLRKGSAPFASNAKEEILTPAQ
jgi:L-malate glycosyltransferase